MTPPPQRSRRLVAALLAAALLTSACASSETEPQRPTASTDLVTGLVNVDDSGTPVTGGTLTVAEYSEARSLDPLETYSNGSAGGSAILAVYDSLMAYDWATQKFVPRLAESLETSDDLTWTLTLRDGVTFSDGTPLDADAVVGSISHYTENYGYGGLQWLSNVKAMKKLDDSTVEFTTRFPWATFPNLLAHGPGLIMAPAAYADPENFKPIGAGPFTFASYAPAESLVLTANDDYFNGRPHLDQLRFVWPGGDAAKVETFKNGDVDATFLRDDVAIGALIRAGTPGMRWVTGGGANIVINRRPGHPGAIREVREALQLAWDPVAYATRLGDDVSLATKSLTAPSSPWHTDTQGIAFDRDLARTKLAEARARGYDGRIRLMHFSDAASTRAAVTTQAMLQAAGFTVVLRPVSSIADQMKALYVSHDFDLSYTALSLPDEDPYLRFAGDLTPGSPTNTTGYDNPRMATLVTELAAAQGPADGKATMRRIEELWQSDAPALNISTGLWFGTWTAKVHGIVPTTETMLFYDKAWKQQ